MVDTRSLMARFGLSEEVAARIVALTETDAAHCNEKECTNDLQQVGLTLAIEDAFKNDETFHASPGEIASYVVAPFMGPDMGSEGPINRATTVIIPEPGPAISANTNQRNEWYQEQIIRERFPGLNNSYAVMSPTQTYDAIGGLVALQRRVNQFLYRYPNIKWDAIFPANIEDTEDAMAVIEGFNPAFVPLIKGLYVGPKPPFRQTLTSYTAGMADKLTSSIWIKDGWNTSFEDWAGAAIHEASHLFLDEIYKQEDQKEIEMSLEMIQGRWINDPRVAELEDKLDQWRLTRFFDRWIYVGKRFLRDKDFPEIEEAGESLDEASFVVDNLLRRYVHTDGITIFPAYLTDGDRSRLEIDGEMLLKFHELLRGNEAEGEILTAISELDVAQGAYLSMLERRWDLATVKSASGSPYMWKQYRLTDEHYGLPSAYASMNTHEAVAEMTRYIYEMWRPPYTDDENHNNMVRNYVLILCEAGFLVPDEPACDTVNKLNND